ncbi:MAG TPA: hypothetical protein VIX86_16760, partial [Streptosporangiaceae bacterium]
MIARPVSAGTRRTCQALAVTGGLAMMTGLLLALISAVAGPSFLGGRTPVSLVASGLIVAGLFCGVTLIAVTAPGSRRSRARARTSAPAPVGAPASAPGSGPPGGDPPGGHRRGIRRRRVPGPPRPREPDPSEEWMDALRPPGPPLITGPLPVVRPPPPATPAVSDYD